MPAEISVSENVTCLTCGYCMVVRQDKGMGRCHRYPPTVTIDGVVFPKVDLEGDWCAEHVSDKRIDRKLRRTS